MRYFLFIFLLLVSASAVQAGGGITYGHHAVTLPKDCAALQSDEDRPALHYMTKSYTRCMELSKKILHRHQTPEPDVNQNQDIVKEQETVPPRPKNYYRVTPATKE